METHAPAHPGVNLNQHPEAFTSSELSDISALAGLVARRSRPLGDAMTAWLAADAERRHDDGDEPAEPVVLHLNCSHWSNAEIADALIVGFCCYDASTDSTERVRALMHRIVLTLVAWTSHRLEQGATG